MRILYDHQAFMRTRYSGIPKYFAELIHTFSINKMVNVSLADAYCVNADYQNLFPSKKESLSWKFQEYISSHCQKLTNINPCSHLPVARKTDINLLNDGDFDVFHPTFFDTYFLKHLHGKPFVLTIHDLSQELYPEYAPLTVTMPRDTESLVSHASRFIADSKSTKNLFVDYYGVDADLVDVVYLGPTFNEEVLSSAIHNIHQGSKPYLLFVNIRGGRKNTYTCLAVLKKLIIEYNLDVVCAGGGHFSKEEIIFFQNHGIADRLFQYSVNDIQLSEIYKGALAFVFPSVHEGFGLPILEAFSCGCPVICSNTSCFPEVGGDAVIYFEPKSALSIRNAVYKVLDDDKLRNKMKSDGYKQLKNFSWNKCAEETKRVYLKVLNDSK